jgi:ribosomal protein S12 methylthiotransferase
MGPHPSLLGMPKDRPTVALVTLGCARNEVDSEELAARLEADGFLLSDDADRADVALINTCGFIEAAKKDSIDTLLAAADGKEVTNRKVVAVGCLAQRYGAELASALPEADAILGFDDYPEISARVQQVLSGHRPAPPVVGDRRTLLPITPVSRASSEVVVPGHAVTGAVSGAVTGAVTGAESGSAAGGLVPQMLRRRLDAGPTAPLKLASGCDRRCTFCAIPTFRGAFISREPSEVAREAEWLVSQGVQELYLVSENTTSYGKDLGNLRALELLLPTLGELCGRVRVSYLQPAEMRPSLIEAIATTPGVVPYFDLSFQHASASVLRAMKRFGDSDSFLKLVADVRGWAPTAGIRSNVIVGFPGETEEDFETLCQFVVEASLDVVGVFGYSDEDGTAAAGLANKLSAGEIAARVSDLSDLVERVAADRAQLRVGETTSVLIEEVDEVVGGRAVYQGPEVDGTTRLVGTPRGALAVGDIVSAQVVGAEGIDLMAEVEAMP